MERNVSRKIGVTWVQVVQGRCWCLDEAGLQAKWRPLSQVHVMLSWWISTHRLQAKRRHGWFKSDLPVKGGICHTWPIPRFLLLEGKFGGWTIFWYTNCVDHLKSTIGDINNSLVVDNTALNNYGYEHRPYSYSFRPELDTTEELGEELANMYQQLIGMLGWSIKLWSIYILKEWSCLHQHSCSTR